MMSLQLMVVYTTFCCCLGCLNFGLTIGFSSPALPQLQKKGELFFDHTEMASLFGSLCSLGGAVGCIVAGWLSETHGRRLTTFYCSILFVIGWLMIAMAASTDILLIGRFITGISSSIAAVLAPIYVAETSPKAWRGILVTVTCFCITLGVFTGYCMGLALNWRTQAGVGSMLALIGILMVPFAPESPRYLAKIGQSPKAQQALVSLQGEGAHVDKELAEIEESLREKSASFLEVIQTPSMRKSLVVAVGLMTFSSLTGIAVIMFFMSSIFIEAGYSDRDSLLAPAVIVGLQLISIVVSGMIIDRVGRIPLLICTGMGMALSYVIMGLCFYAKTTHLLWIFLCLVGYKFCFGLGWGVVAPLMATEINPTRSRGPATALSHMMGNIVSFLLAASFTIMQYYIGPHGVLWFYAFLCLLGTWFALNFVPETKGKTLEEIEMFFVADYSGF